MGEAAVDYVIDFIHGLSDAPAQNVDGALEAALKLKASPPEEGGSFEDVFAEFRDAAARAYETCGPGYLPYVPGGGLYASALGQFLAMSVNRFPNLWEVAPGLVADRAERDPMAVRPLRVTRRTRGGSSRPVARSRTCPPS